MAVSIIGLLMGVLLPSLRNAREQARTGVCASNVRQLAIANVAYACDYQGRYCPGAPDDGFANLHRWHGTRDRTSEPFDARRGPLAPYLGVDQGIRACPSFQDFVKEGVIAFEKGNGGYGYNQAYLGRILQQGKSGSFRVVTTRSGIQCERVRGPGETVMFADAALAAVTDGVIEYSFAEPRFHPEWLQLHARADPSIHSRHRGTANVAWCDGHVDPRMQTFTWRSGVYPGDPARNHLGWFGERDDNGYFDLE